MSQQKNSTASPNSRLPSLVQKQVKDWIGYLHFWCLLYSTGGIGPKNHCLRLFCYFALEKWLINEANWSPKTQAFWETFLLIEDVGDAVEHSHMPSQWFSWNMVNAPRILWNGLKPHIISLACNWSPPCLCHLPVYTLLFMLDICYVMSCNVYACVSV